MTMTKNIMRMLTVALVAGTAACSDVLSLEVEAPGRIADEDLNTTEAVAGLVAGMSYDLTQSMDGTLQQILLAGGEVWHGGSYNWGTYPRGDLHSSPEDWDGPYGTLQQARWVAEAGIRRISELYESATFEKSALVARAYLLAGFANRNLGELQCESTIDGGPVVANSEHFVRADSLFSRAITIATAANNAQLKNAALAGRASVRAWLGNWAAADADAAQVPANFVYNAIFSTAVGAVNNDFVFETTSRFEYTVWNTMWQDVTNDPRVPWVILYDANNNVRKGQDGNTDMYQQRKFLTQDTDIPLAKGTEMLVLRAEKALRDDDLVTMTTHLNAARAQYGMAPIAQPAMDIDAWPILRRERAATLWLEGRRLWDLRRWQADGSFFADPFAQGRDLCFPISREEARVNPNVGG